MHTQGTQNGGHRYSNGKRHDLSQLRKLVQGKPFNSKDEGLRPFLNVLNDVSVTSDGKYILKGNKLIMPTSLHNLVITLGHEGHQGLIKTKRLIRSKVWFHGIDKMVEETISKCNECYLNSKPTPSEPLHMTRVVNDINIFDISYIV